MKSKKKDFSNLKLFKYFEHKLEVVNYIFLMPKKSKRARIERILKDREPKINENPKKALIIKGTKPSQTAKDVIKELVYYKINIFYYIY